VSHDRYFVDALATRVIEVGRGRVESYFGNYEDFLRAKAAQGDASHSAQRVEALSGGLADLPAGDKEARRRQHGERKGELRQEKRRQKELGEIEARIEVLERELADLELAMADSELYRDAAGWQRASARHGQLQGQIAATYEQWEALQEPEPEAGRLTSGGNS
jgi:ATP-binding cassette subfamily F protein 3